MKKPIILFFTSMLLASCSLGGGGSSQETDSEGNKIVKIMFHVDSKSKEGQAYKKRIDAFNTAYKDKKIKASATFKARTTGASSYETELINLKTEGRLPDIITFDAPNCASYANGNLLYDLSSVLSSDDTSAFISTPKYNGKVYGLPIQESSAGFYYNKTMFAECGIDVSKYTVDNPWTFSEFMDVCQKLKDNGKTPVDMRLDATKDEMAVYLLYPIIYAYGGSFTSEDGLTATGYFNSQETKNGFQFLQDMVKKGYSSNSIGSTDFFTGKVGMYLSSGWTIPDLDNDYKSTFPDRNSWGLLPYPKGVATASATGSWCYGITDNGVSDKSAAKELLLWMSSSESSNVITDATGMIPARSDVNKNYEAGSPEAILSEQLSKTGKARPATVAYPKFSTLFNQIISEIIVDGANVSDIVENKTSSLERELQNYK